MTDHSVPALPECCAPLRLDPAGRTTRVFTACENDRDQTHDIVSSCHLTWNAAEQDFDIADVEFGDLTCLTCGPHREAFETRKVSLPNAEIVRAELQNRRLASDRIRQKIAAIAGWVDRICPRCGSRDLVFQGRAAFDHVLDHDVVESADETEADCQACHATIRPDLRPISAHERMVSLAALERLRRLHADDIAQMERSGWAAGGGQPIAGPMQDSACKRGDIDR